LVIQVVISKRQLTVAEAKAQLSSLLDCEPAPSAQPRPMECSRDWREASPQASAAGQLGLAARLSNKPEPGSGAEPTGSQGSDASLA